MPEASNRAGAGVPPAGDEITRILKAYRTREAAGLGKRYSLFSPAQLFAVQQREREMLNLLPRLGVGELSRKRILEVGCGSGVVLRDLVRYGARPEFCYGIDLLPKRVAKARGLSPNMTVRIGNAAEMGFEDGYFDLVLSFTLFSSILERELKVRVAAQMLRVLKPAGVILWYDFFRNNPGNLQVRGITRREVEELFPGCQVYLKRITLAPPLARLLAPYSWWACYVLEKLKFFNTHYLGAITRQ